MCAETGRRAAPARRGPAQPRADVHLPRLLPAVHRPRARNSATGRSPSGTCPSRGSGSTPRSGTSCRSRWGWRSCSRTPQWTGRSAFYPGPAGATESDLPLDAWAAITAANPALRVLAPDVEALLIRAPAPGRAGPAGFECHLVPVDACYELVGLLRRTWRGFDGGQEARAALAGFFATVAARSRPAGSARMTTLRVRRARHRRGALRRHAESAGTAADRGDHRRDGPRARAALPGPGRTAPAPLRRRGGAGAARPVRAPGSAGPRRKRSFAWLHTNAMVPGFTDATDVDLVLPCTYDVEVAGAKYLQALGDGHVPLTFLFSGTVFTRGEQRVRRRTGAVAPRGGLPAAGRRVART